jgi:hypothetical protein
MGLPGGTEKPEVRLSQLIERELGISINPPALRILIRSHWDEVQGLAHDIHGTRPVRSGAGLDIKDGKIQP